MEADPEKDKIDVKVDGEYTESLLLLLAVAAHYAAESTEMNEEKMLLGAREILKAMKGRWEEVEIDG